MTLTLNVCVSAQEYVTSMQANLVRSLMNLIEMLVKEAALKEDAKENKHLRVWLTVCSPYKYMHLYEFSERSNLFGLNLNLNLHTVRVPVRRRVVHRRPHRLRGTPEVRPVLPRAAQRQERGEPDPEAHSEDRDPVPRSCDRLRLLL